MLGIGFLVFLAVTVAFVLGGSGFLLGAIVADNIHRHMPVANRTPFAKREQPAPEQTLEALDEFPP